jgi:hypothetical protein
MGIRLSLPPRSLFLAVPWLMFPFFSFFSGKGNKMKKKKKTGNGVAVLIEATAPDRRAAPVKVPFSWKPP